MNNVNGAIQTLTFDEIEACAGGEVKASGLVGMMAGVAAGAAALSAPVPPAAAAMATTAVVLTVIAGAFAAMGE